MFESAAVLKKQTWKALKEIEVPEKLKRVIKRLYEHVYGMVRIEGETNRFLMDETSR